MDALKFVSDTMEWIADKFDNTASFIVDIPLLGKYLASPFYFLADKFEYLSILFLNIEKWFDWLKTSFEALPTWEELVNMLEAQWDILTKTPEEVFKWLQPYLPEIPKWIPTTLEELIDLIKESLPEIPTIETVIEWIGEQFEKVLDIAFKEDK